MKNKDDKRKLQVLLVEDSMPVLRRIRGLIEETVPSAVVGEAGSILEALTIFRAKPPEAVVMDLFLSDGASFSFIAEIKRRRPEIMVIVMTHFTIPECRERCRALGADHFFEKSKEFERVPQELNELCNAKEYQLTV